MIRVLISWGPTYDRWVVLCLWAVSTFLAAESCEILGNGPFLSFFSSPVSCLNWSDGDTFGQRWARGLHGESNYVQSVLSSSCPPKQPLLFSPVFILGNIIFVWVTYFAISPTLLLWKGTCVQVALIEAMKWHSWDFIQFYQTKICTHSPDQT